MWWWTSQARLCTARVHLQTQCPLRSTTLCPWCIQRRCRGAITRRRACVLRSLLQNANDTQHHPEDENDPASPSLPAETGRGVASRHGTSGKSADGPHLLLKVIDVLLNIHLRLLRRVGCAHSDRLPRLRRQADIRMRQIRPLNTFQSAPVVRSIEQAYAGAGASMQDHARKGSVAMIGGPRWPVRAF